MKKMLTINCLQLIIIILFPAIGKAEDYQRQYFNEEKEKYVPFSDYIPRVRLHYKVTPHYLEDYYELYGMKLYYNENSLRKNIARLKTSLKCNFRHPSEALVKVETKKEYLKYRRLMFMRINILIMRNYMRVASKYDKQRIYFYNADFAKEIKESLDIAEDIYKKAIPYWKNAWKYAKSASEVKITTDLGNIESERFSIITRELKYGEIINNHLKRIEKKRQKLNNELASRRK